MQCLERIARAAFRRFYKAKTTAQQQSEEATIAEVALTMGGQPPARRPEHGGFSMTHSSTSAQSLPPDPLPQAGEGDTFPHALAQFATQNGIDLWGQTVLRYTYQRYQQDLSALAHTEQVGEVEE